MSIGFWHRSNPKAIEAFRITLGDYKINRPGEFRKIIAKEWKQLQGDSLAQSQFRKFLNSLP